jgi:hypothetical protein
VRSIPIMTDVFSRIRFPTVECHSEHHRGTCSHHEGVAHWGLSGWLRRALDGFMGRTGPPSRTDTATRMAMDADFMLSARGPTAVGRPTFSHFAGTPEKSKESARTTLATPGA